MITIFLSLFSPYGLFPLINDKISDASGGETFWDLKWAETFKSEVFGAEMFGDPKINVYSHLVNDDLSTKGE